MSWWSDLVAAVESAAGGSSNVLQSGGQTPAGPVTTPGGGIGQMITVIEGIYAGLTDGKFWRSLGWLLLGVVLMLLGAWWWAGRPVPAPVPA